MTAEEFKGIQQIVQRYNHVFIEADVLRYENRIFQKELLVAYQEIAELRSRLDNLQEGSDVDLSKIIPQVFEPQVTLEPLPVEIQIFQELPEEIEVILATQEEAKEAVKVAKKRARKPKASNIVSINKKHKTGGDIPF